VIIRVQENWIFDTDQGGFSMILTDTTLDLEIS